MFVENSPFSFALGVIELFMDILNSLVIAAGSETSFFGVCFQVYAFVIYS